jgi:hypothetical protein
MYTVLVNEIVRMGTLNCLEDLIWRTSLQALKCCNSSPHNRLCV